jgi:hypothetical protein
MLGELWQHPNLPGYDVMGGDGARRSSHASVNTKNLLGWIRGGIVKHVGGMLHVNLHGISLMQPPLPDRVTAAWIPSQLSENRFVVVQARVGTDQFDQMVPKQGVLVYEVNNRVNVELLIAPALSKGEKYDNTEESCT